MKVTIEWVADESAYIVRQSGQFIGDFEELLPAAEFSLDVANHAGMLVEIIAVER